MPAPSSLRVVVVGGGIGGLCLAQGLRRAGVAVTVHERDRTPTDRLQGYRIRINPTGSRALQACLPPPLFDAFVDTSGRDSGTFRLLTERLGVLLSVDTAAMERAADPVHRHRGVSRMTLRQVLAADLDGVVHYGRTYLRYERTAHGTVRAFFEDGTTAEGDVLVGADGGRSRVRAQYLPRAERVHTGYYDIAAKIPLTDVTRKLLPPVLADGPSVIRAPRGGMFVATQEFAHAPGAHGGIGGNDPGAGPVRGLLLDNTADYIMWAYMGHRFECPRDADPYEGGHGLQDLVLRLVSGWHPALDRLVRASDPESLSLLPIHTSTPVPPWPTTRVTLLGDAIHSMTPYRGIGANTALRDAQALCRELAAADRGERPLADALRAYEAQMVRYGFAAVRSSLRALRQATSTNRVRLAAMRTALRAVDAVPPLKRLAWRGLGG